MKTKLLRSVKAALRLQKAETLVRNSIYACENIEQFAIAYNLLENSKAYITNEQYEALKKDFEFKMKSKNITFEHLKQPKNETLYS